MLSEKLKNKFRVSSEQLPLILALFCTMLLTVMAAWSGWQRAGESLEQFSFAGLSALLVVAVHLLPALSRKTLSTWQQVPVALVWLGAFILVLVGHGEFFTHAEVNAGGIRVAAASTALYPGSTAISTGEERSTGAVSSELTKAQKELRLIPLKAETRRADQEQLIVALERELEQAKKRELLIEERQRQSTDFERGLRQDPMGKRLEALTGLEHDKIMVLLSLSTALILEVLSVLLWFIALSPNSAGTNGTDPGTEAKAGAVLPVPEAYRNQLRNISAHMHCANDEKYCDATIAVGVNEGSELPEDIRLGVERVRAAIQGGELIPRPTVESIRTRLCIGKGKAVQIRRLILEQSFKVSVPN